MGETPVEIEVHLKRKDFFKLFGLAVAANVVTYVGTSVVIRVMEKKGI